jgi:hypothetical protein
MRFKYKVSIRSAVVYEGSIVETVVELQIEAGNTSALPTQQRKLVEMLSGELRTQYKCPRVVGACPQFQTPKWIAAPSCYPGFLR